MLDHLKKLLDSIVSIVLPKEESVLNIEKIDLGNTEMEIPKANDINNGKFKALFQYRNKMVRQAIWEIKYRGNKSIIRKFSVALYEFILDELGDEITFDNFRNPVLVPIPGSKASLKERGFNQCELIARELAHLDENRNFTIEFSALKKVRETPHQSKLKNRSKRLKNLDGCFSADTKKVEDRCIILIDDVITTGATMNEASKTLRKAGAKKVIGFSIAH
jgi:ComF family protein